MFRSMALGILFVLLSFLPARAALLQYSGDFTPVAGAPAHAGLLNAHIDAVWDTDTGKFDSFLLEIQNLPETAAWVAPVFAIENYAMPELFLPDAQASGTGAFFDPLTGLLTYKVESDFEFVTSLVNSVTDVVLAGNALSGGFATFTIFDNFIAPGSNDFAAAGSGAALLEAAFVSEDQAGNFPDRIPVATVPLPASMLLMLTGMAGLACFRRRSKSS